MSDVSVNVMVDGKTVFAHGAVNAPNAYVSALGALRLAVQHFQDTLASRMPPQRPPSLGIQVQGAGAQNKPQDSL